MQYDHYEAVGPLFIRMASAPRSRYVSNETADSRTRIRELAADPLLREAVQVASSSLADVLDRLDSGAELGPKGLAKTALSLTRYALRHCGRPTPFGLFAGVAVAQLGPAARVEIMGPGRKTARLDGPWLDDRIRQWLQLPGVRRRVDVVVNDLCRPRGGRLILAAGERDFSVRRTALVAWVCEAAATPTPYDQLLEKAVATFPEVPAERIDSALAQLLQHGFLLSSIGEPDLDGRTLARVEAAIAPVQDAVQDLHRIQAALRTYEQTPPGEGGGAWRRAIGAFGLAGNTGNPPVQVDLRLDADIRLPEAVVEEARHYASAMWAISPNWAAFPHIRNYRDAFINRYGMTGLVPLGELVDPHRGLGFPEGYRGRSGPPPTPGPTDAATEARRSLTAELVQDALESDGAELRLTPEVLSRLAVDDLPETAWKDMPPQSIELCFQLLADSTSALDRGEFRLVTGPHSGSLTAGATVGRFAELTGSTDELARLLGRLGNGRTLPAQVVFRPHDPSALNPLRVPRLLPHHIPVGVYSDPDRPGHIDWRQLLVGVDASGMRLVDHRSGRTVLPVVPHLVNPQRLAPPAARLLIDFGLARTRVWTGWDWCGLEVLPFLPRVTLGRVTLCPRRWKPDRHLRATATEPGNWDRSLADWRNRYRVPRHVQIVRHDRGFAMDLHNPLHRAMLRHEVRTGSPFLITEDPTAEGAGLGWAQGHRTEVVIPLIQRPPTDVPASPKTPARPVRVRTDIRHLPGEDWLYTKLYATEDSHNELLATHLPPLLRDIDDHIDRWFFIRYRDPEAHLRIRFHGDPEALRCHVLPELSRHVRALQDRGLIRTMTLDAYEPEVARYGGPEALPIAEHLFHLDSRSVLEQLALRSRGALNLPDEVLAAANHVMLLESLGDWDWCAWVDRVFPKGPSHTAFQQHRSLARDIIRPTGTAAAVAERFAAAHGLAAMWTNAPESRAYGESALADDVNPLLGLLHMQHNRLLGISHDREDRGYAILRGIAREHLGRRRHIDRRKDH